jgi:hypothetical protein
MSPEQLYQCEICGHVGPDTAICPRCGHLMFAHGPTTKGPAGDDVETDEEADDRHATELEAIEGPRPPAAAEIPAGGPRPRPTNPRPEATPSQAPIGQAQPAKGATGPVVSGPGTWERRIDDQLTTLGDLVLQLLERVEELAMITKWMRKIVETLDTCTNALTVSGVQLPRAQPSQAVPDHTTEPADDQADDQAEQPHAPPPPAKKRGSKS